MVDSALLAARIAAARDVTARGRTVLTPTAEAFIADRTTREVVTLNRFVAIQACIDVATHWVADAGWDMPGTYGEVFASLAHHSVVEPGPATRLAGAAAFRNLVAHQYGVLDGRRVYTLAAAGLDDIDAFCAAIADRVHGSPPPP